MNDFLEKAIFASVGIAYLTSEKVAELGRKLVEEAHVAEKDGKRFVEELQKKADEARGATTEFVNRQVAAALRKLNVPSREEVEALKERVARLEQQTHSHSGAA